MTASTMVSFAQAERGEGYSLEEIESMVAQRRTNRAAEGPRTRDLNRIELTLE